MKRKIFLLLSAVTVLFMHSHITVAADTLEFTVPQKGAAGDRIYLSDIEYMEDKSFACGNHTIHLDETDDNDTITLFTKVDGENSETTKFIKGVAAWATSEIVYDLTDYSAYDYFTTYLGVDAYWEDYFDTGVKFFIYTSKDGKTWDEQYASTKAMTVWSQAEFVKISLKDAKYLKLVADENGNDWYTMWYDGAVYADAKLIKEGYTESAEEPLSIKTVAEYDAQLKTYSGAEAVGTYEDVLLQREFVNNIGYDVLQALARCSNEYKETIEWLLGDTQTLRLYLVAGKPEGNYVNSIRVLSDLYTRYKDTDLVNQNKTKYGNAYKDVYRTMILALSLTHSGNAYFWMDGLCHSDAVTRYELYKGLHLHEDTAYELIENEIFESLTVEEMRWVMNTIIDDEEILWLNDWVRNKGQGKISPYNYITYTFGYDYTLDKYYSAENYDMWNQKYSLADYGITYKAGQQKLWHVFEEGSVCGGLSKTGSCIWGAYKGLPNTCISQPAHCAYIYYTWDEDGNVKWEVGNNVSGWGQSGKTEHLNTRTMNDWGSGSYTTGWNANYILLAQAAQNEYDKYEAAEKIMMLAKVYEGDSQKLEEIYRKALEAEEINFDAWLGLVELYDKDATRTEEAYYELATEIAQTLVYYPYPMNDLLKLIEPHFTSVGYQTMFGMLQTRALTIASRATKAESIQYEAVKQVANQLLGNMDTSLASFSFDGENAGKIILSDRYSGTDVAWQYSLDGASGEDDNWILTEDHEVQLTAEQIASITAENDIKIHVMGVDYSEENVYVIDIKESEGLPSLLCMNDLENKLIGAVDTMEWRYSEAEEWTSYGTAQPNLEGNVSVMVRAGATGVYLPQKVITIFTFTQEPKVDTQRYVPIERLSVHYVSSEQGGSDLAAHVIDGNINTIWHTKHDASDTERTIVLKVDEPIYLSVFQYVPRQSGTNGRAKDSVLYVSMDGETWTEVAAVTDWENNAEPKAIVLGESVQAQYIKFVTTANHGDGRSFASAAMINLYEDVTKKIEPTAEVIYDTMDKTEGPVRAKLVNPSTEIQITNNDGSDTYVFTENGEFTFEFEDQNGNKGTATAKVTWIVKESAGEGGDDQEPDNGSGDSGDNTQKPDEGDDESDNSDGDSGDNTQKPDGDNKEPDNGNGDFTDDTQKPSDGNGQTSSGGNQTSGGSGNGSLSGSSQSPNTSMAAPVNKSQNTGAISSMYNLNKSTSANDSKSKVDQETENTDADKQTDTTVKEDKKDQKEASDQKTDENAKDNSSGEEAPEDVVVTSTNGYPSKGLSDTAKKTLAALAGLAVIGAVAFVIAKKK